MAMLILTDDEVLTRGLDLVGFGDDCQAREKKETNVERFADHFGSKPQVLRSDLGGLADDEH
jgi:hypothetical protein